LHFPRFDFLFCSIRSEPIPHLRYNSPKHQDPELHVSPEKQLWWLIVDLEVQVLYGRWWSASIAIVFIATLEKVTAPFLKFPPCIPGTTPHFYHPHLLNSPTNQWREFTYINQLAFQ